MRQFTFRTIFTLCGNKIVTSRTFGLEKAVHLSLKFGNLPYNDYKNTVFVFADKIEDFYNKSKPKTVPKDEKGYRAFWNEWKSIRY